VTLVTAVRQVVVVTGMSGSGKSTAIRALEDAGYFCIDNLPAPLLPKVADLAGPEAQKLAFVIDVREGRFLDDAPHVLDEMRRAGHTVELLFLDSSDEALHRRYSETRRRHPLAPYGSVADGIAHERAALKALREESQHVLDTSALTVHELKTQIQRRFGSKGAAGLALTVMSFGFKYGVPPQADLLFDVRFLPNPYFVPELKALTGRDPAVAGYVLEREETAEFLKRLEGLLDFLLPRYQREGKSYLTVAIGCTGGKHRSVAVAQALLTALKGKQLAAQLWDRDIEKE
jgi:RNase adapter protein RapZ